MKKINLLFFCLLFSVLLFSQNLVKIDDLGLENMYMIDSGIYRSEQPNEEQFILLENYGISEILNLRQGYSDNDEAKGTKLKLHHINMRAGNIKDEDIIEILRTIKNRKGNILIHCLHGSDRTGVAIAMYRIVFQNWTKEAAIEELKLEKLGFHGIFKNIPKYIENVDIEEIKKNLGI